MKKIEIDLYTLDYKIDKDRFNLNEDYWIFNKLRECVSKNIKIEIRVKNYNQALTEINNNQVFPLIYFFNKVFKGSRFKKRIFIKGIKKSETILFLEDFYKNCVKSIVVIDDNTNSEKFRNFSDIELISDKNYQADYVEASGGTESIELKADYSPWDDFEDPRILHKAEFDNQVNFDFPYYFKNKSDVQVYKDGLKITQTDNPTSNLFYSVSRTDDGGGCITLGGNGVNTGDNILIFRELKDHEYPEKGKEEIFFDFFTEMFYSDNRLALVKYKLPNIEDRYPYDFHIFVKKKFLDKRKKIIFNNIKHIYFYHLDKEFPSPSKKELNLPKSLNYKSLELLYLDGNYINFKNFKKNNDFKNLKKMFLQGGVDKGNSLRTLPKFDKLEHLYIDNCYGNTKFIIDPFKGFENCINLKKITIDNQFNSKVKIKDCKINLLNISEIECDKFIKLKKLKTLELDGLTINDLSNLRGLKSLEELSVTPKIYQMDNDDIKLLDKPLRSEDFVFLKDMKNLKDLNLSLPLNNAEIKHMIEGDKLVNYINKNLESIHLSIGYLVKDFDKGNIIIKSINKRFNKLKELSLNLHDDKKTKRVLDLKLFNKLRNLEEFSIRTYGYHQIKYKNILEILKFKKLKKISIDTELNFTKAEVAKIFNSRAGDKEKFMLNYNIKNKGDTYQDQYELPDKIYDKYSKIKGKKESNLIIWDTPLVALMFDKIRKN